MPNKKLEHINYNGTTYDLGITEVATATTSGLMSASDKSKLDSIDPGAAGVNVVATYTEGTKIGTIAVGGSETDLYTPTYTGSSPITVSGFTIKHATSGVTASNYGETTNKTLAFGASFKVLSASVNSTGHITSLAARTVTLPSLSIERNLTSGAQVAKFSIDGTEYQLYAPQNTNTTYTLTKSDNKLVLTPSSGTAQTVTLNLVTTGTNSADGLMSSADKARLDAMSDNANYTTITPTYTTGNSVAVFNADGTETTVYIPPYPTIESLGLNKVLKFIGFSTTAITDGQSTTPTVSGVTGYTPVVGDVVIDGSNASSTTQYEYVYTSANKWERLGGDNTYALAGTEYDVTNGGTNAASAVTISPKTTSIYSMTSAGSVENGTQTTFSMSVANEKLTFTFEANSPTVVTLPGRSSAINAWTGYNTGVSNTYAAAQTFSPTTKKITIN